MWTRVHTQKYWCVFVCFFRLPGSRSWISWTTSCSLMIRFLIPSSWSTPLTGRDRSVCLSVCLSVWHKDHLKLLFYVIDTRSVPWTQHISLALLSLFSICQSFFSISQSSALSHQLMSRPPSAPSSAGSRDCKNHLINTFTHQCDKPLQPVASALNSFVS